MTECVDDILTNLEQTGNREYSIPADVKTRAEERTAVICKHRPRSTYPPAQ